MAQQLQAMAPDVVLLQEVFTSLDGRWHTARDLARALGMQWAFAPARPKLRCCDGVWTDSHSGMAVLSRGPIQTEHVVVLPTSVADGGRVAQWCDVNLNGQALRLANVHLSHLLPEQGGAELRQQQLRHVLCLSELQDFHVPALVCGDFNASLQSPELSPFMAPVGDWCDAHRTAGAPRKCTHVTVDGEGFDLDHVLFHCKSALHWRAASVVMQGPSAPGGVPPSDHAGVCVDGLLTGR
jgi:endonuclease/exonuclease/phosphatase family metal-dependent hydrolase